MIIASALFLFLSAYNILVVAPSILHYWLMYSSGQPYEIGTIICSHLTNEDIRP